MGIDLSAFSHAKKRQIAANVGRNSTARGRVDSNKKINMKSYSVDRSCTPKPKRRVKGATTWR